MVFTFGAFLAFALSHDIPRMISGEIRLMSETAENLLKYWMWSTIPMLLVVFLLGQLAKTDDELVSWHHVRGALIGLMIVGAVVLITREIQKHLPTDLPLLAITIPMALSLVLPLDHPNFRTTRILWLWLVPEHKGMRDSKE